MIFLLYSVNVVNFNDCFSNVKHLVFLRKHDFIMYYIYYTLFVSVYDFCTYVYKYKHAIPWGEMEHGSQHFFLV